MTEILLKNARLVLRQGITRGAVLVRSGRIAAVFDPDETPAGLDRASAVDIEGRYLAPGLIDVHIHGSAGVDVLTAGTGQWAKLSHFLLSQGVTGYFPTFVPVTDAEYKRALSSLASLLSSSLTSDARGARILGVHFEGPFVSAKRCGALHPALFRTYDGDPGSLEVFTPWRPVQNVGSDRQEFAQMVVLMTVAPEIDRGITLIQDLYARGVRVFVGHSTADPDVLDLAAQAGARHITHFPNALEPLHHRRPGAVGWGLVREDVSLDCIADYHHVHPLVLKLIYQSKGPDRMALISDAIPPTGLGDGDYEVWGDRVAVRDGRTSVADQGASDTLAGSVITLLDAVKNVVALGVPLHHAIGMASQVPARAAGIDSEYGDIGVGKRADLVAFDDNLKVRMAMVDGEIALEAR